MRDPELQDSPGSVVSQNQWRALLGSGDGHWEERFKGLDLFVLINLIQSQKFRYLACKFQANHRVLSTI